MGGEEVMNLLLCDSRVRVFLLPVSLPVRSRFAPGFTPDSRSNLIALRRTRSDKFTHYFNANIVHGLTPSHSIPIPIDRPFKARAQGSSSSRVTT
jgi:hypothetical protein